MKIEIFGPGCYRCKQIEQLVLAATSELKIPADISKVTDVAKIVDAGIMATPGLRIKGTVKCSGRIPTLAEIKKWIQEAQ